MVQVLPGFDAQLGQNLAGIVDAVQNVIDPDFQVKKLIRQKALADPTYAQSLANFAYTNPGIYKRMGLDKVGEVIGGISPDLKTVIEEAQKGFVAQEAKSPSNADLQKAGAEKQLYGMTDVQFQNQKLENIQAGINIALSKQTGTIRDQQIKENEKQLEQLEIQSKGIQDAIGNYPALKNTKLAPLALDFINGKADSNLISQIFSTPQLAKPFQDLVNLEMEKLRLRNQLYVAQYSRGLRERDVDNDMWLRSHGVGTPDLWRKYRTDPATQEKLAALVADPKSAKTPEDQMLLAMNESINAQQNGSNAKAIKDALTVIGRVSAQSRLAGSDLQSLADQANVALAALEEKTGERYVAAPVTDTTKIVRDYKRDIEKITPGIGLFDKDGNRVSVGALTARASGAPVNTTQKSDTTTKTANKPPARNAKESDADYWERLKQAGFSSEQATSIVKGGNK